MKRLRLMSFMLLMVASMSLLVSCSKDEDDDVKRIESPIIGTWRITATQLTYTLQFTDLGKINLETVVKGNKTTYKGTFEVSSGYNCIVKIYWSNDDTPEFWDVVVSGNKMTTKGLFGNSNGLTWTKI